MPNANFPQTQFTSSGSPLLNTGDIEVPAGLDIGLDQLWEHTSLIDNSGSIPHKLTHTDAPDDRNTVSKRLLFHIGYRKTYWKRQNI